METSEKIKEFLTAAGEVIMFILTQIWEGMKIVGSWIYKWVSEWLETVNFPTMIKIFSNITVNRVVFIAIAAYILFINIKAFCLFAKDKKIAKDGRKKQNRISERKLMRACFFGGATGGLIGMSVFRHKTLHKKFTVGVTFMFVLQLIVFSFVLGFLGFWAFL